MFLVYLNIAVGKGDIAARNVPFTYTVFKRGMPHMWQNVSLPGKVSTSIEQLHSDNAFESLCCSYLRSICKLLKFKINLSDNPKLRIGFGF